MKRELKVLWEGKSPLKSRDALSIADEPNKVRVVDLSGRFHDKRFGTVMVQGLIEDNDGINEGWNSNYGERVAVKLLLDEVQRLKECNKIYDHALSQYQALSNWSIDLPKNNIRRDVAEKARVDGKKVMESNQATTG